MTTSKMEFCCRDDLDRPILSYGQQLLNYQLSTVTIDNWDGFISKILQDERRGDEVEVPGLLNYN